MIFFYDLTTKNITGFIGGRVNTESDKNMFVGDPVTTGKLIIEWLPVKFYDKDGNSVPAGDPTMHTADFELEHAQKDLLMQFENDPMVVHEYRIENGTFSKIGQ